MPRRPGSCSLCSMRPRNIALVLAIVVLVPVVVGGCALSLIASSLPSGEHPQVDFRNPEISAARAAVVPELEAQLDAVEARFGREHVGPRLRFDECEAGQDNFTRQDRYAYSCRMQIVQLMPVREPFVPNASALGEALLEGECPDGTDTDRALAEPFSHPRQVDSSTGDCTPGWRDPAPEIREWLTPESAGEELHSALFYLRCRTSYRGEFCASNRADLRTAVEAAPPDAAYLALVVADDFYYGVPWD